MACTAEGHENIHCGEDENHLREEIISNKKQRFNYKKKQSKKMFLYHKEIRRYLIS